MTTAAGSGQNSLTLDELRVRPSKAVLVILGLALILRLGAVGATYGWYEPKTDALQFDNTATSLADGDGFGVAAVPPNDPADDEPTAFRAPLYPTVLAGLYAVVGPHSYEMGRALNAVLGVVAVGLLGVVVAQLLGRRAALVAMLLAAVDPLLITIGSSLQLEPLLVVTALASIVFLLQYRVDPRVRWLVLSGVAAGLSVLTRETGAFVLVGAVVLVWQVGAVRAAGPAKSRRVAQVAILVGAAVCTVLPWTIRNAVVMDAFVPVSTSSGIGLAGMYNETSRTDPGRSAVWRPPWRDPAVAAEMERMIEEADGAPSEAHASSELTRRSFEFMAEHPDYVAEVMVWNTARLFALDLGREDRAVAPHVPLKRSLVILSTVGSYALYALIALSLLRFRRRLAAVPWALWLIPAASTLFIIVFLPANMRYRYWLEPFLLLLAVPAATWLIDRFTPARRSLPEPDAAA